MIQLSPILRKRPYRARAQPIGSLTALASFYTFLFTAQSSLLWFVHTPLEARIRPYRAFSATATHKPYQREKGKEDREP
jgi:hypothetical protein